jgi:hypothetical protein
MTYFSNLSGPPEPLRVGFIGFDGIAAVDLAGPLEALTIARHRRSWEKRRLVIGRLSSD